MSIPESFVEELKSALRIEDVIGSYVQLKRRGSNLVGLCPFHSEKTPSFSVQPDRGFFHCFGCGAGGDVITFIRKIENLDYPEAIRFLAGRAGLEVPAENEQEARLAQRRLRILEINRESALYFHRTLLSPAGAEGLAYLRRRGVSDTSIKRFGLGFAPDGWDNLCKYLLSKGYTEYEIDEARVTRQARNGNRIDMFRNRVMYPIIDPRGGVIAFGARAMGDEQPKYLNTSDTLVFKKSRNLFALNLAKNTKAGHFILCEGYMDVIAVHAAGFDCAVATLGTALTEEQARIIANYTHEVVLSYDSDEAGQKATRRASGLLDAAGISVRVLQMEGAKDPDEYILKYGAERFGVLVRASAGSAEYQLAQLRKGRDLDNADQKLAYLKDAARLIAGLRSPLEQDTFIGRVAEAAGVERSALQAEVNAQKRRNARQQRREDERALVAPETSRSHPEDPARTRHIRAAAAEDGLLRLLYDNPERLPLFEERVPPERFLTGFNRRVYAFMQQTLRAGRALSGADFAGAFPGEGEMDAIARLFGSEARARWSEEQFSQLCAVLEDERQKQSLSEEAVSGMSPEQILELLRKKSGGGEASPEQ